jgi:hypothetical protein
MGGEAAAYLPQAGRRKEIPCTPTYAAPEMVGLGASPISERTDVYLLGASLFEIATGGPPHRAEDARALFESIATTPPALPAHVPAHLAEICRRALQRHPHKRYASAIELRNAILDFLRRRDSEHVCDEAESALARLREACAADAPRATIYDRHGECRFAFREALRTWPDNDRAREGLTAASVVVIEHELARDPRVAAALLAEAPSSPPAVAQRVQRALDEENEEREVLAKVAREHDPRIGRRGRRVFQVVIAATWLIGVLADFYVPLTHPRFIVGSLVQVPLIALLWKVSPDLGVTLFNRRMVAAAAVTMVAQLGLFVFGALLGADVRVLAVQQLGLWAVAGVLLAILLERRLWPMAIALVVAATAASLAPAVRTPAAAIAVAVVIANFALVRPRES